MEPRSGACSRVSASTHVTVTSRLLGPADGLTSPKCSLCATQRPRAWMADMLACTSASHSRSPRYASLRTSGPADSFRRVSSHQPCASRQEHFILRAVGDCTRRNDQIPRLTCGLCRGYLLNDLESRSTAHAGPSAVLALGAKYFRAGWF